MIRNLIYIPYYILKTPMKDFFENLSYLANSRNVSKFSILIDILNCSARYSTSLQDYFLLRLFRKTPIEREAYAGTGLMYEYQLKMNPKGRRNILSDKIKFFHHYEKFIGRRWFQLSDFENQKLEIQDLLGSSDKIVLKDSKGQAGKEVEVLNSMPFDDLIFHMQKSKFDLLEEFVVQHISIQELAPKGLNTIRVITQLNNNNTVDILGCILRLTIDSSTDNLTAGNAAALINPGTGVVERKAVYGDFRKDDITTHPISGIPILGFQVPLWNEVIALVKEAAINSGGNRSIGWDVAVTNDNPILIEGNHNWGRTLWQLPANKGLKFMLEKHRI